jgi:hypothetical protein
LIPASVLACAVTVAVECPIVAAVYPGQRLRMAGVCALATAATNLAMNLLLRRWLGPGLVHLLVGELSALLLEALVYAVVRRPRDWGRALVASALANGASFSAGFVLWPVVRLVHAL